MPNFRRPVCPADATYGPFSVACTREEGHPGAHLATGVGWTDSAARLHVAPGAGWTDSAARLHGDDESPTERMAPIRETVLRRPPPPEVRELKGAELLRALADAIADDPDVDGEDLDDTERPRPECTVIAGSPPRRCEWLWGSPCLAYGSVGCGMKAQER